MSDYFVRTKGLIGEDAFDKLAHSRVAVFGVGGVGGFVVEGLARGGVGTLDLFDKDVVDASNINRQIIATVDTIKRPKVEVAKERVLSINPEAKVNTYQTFYLPEVAEQYDFSQYDYVVDAVDTVTAKIEIIMRSQSLDVPVISSMGTGNKLDPTKFQIADIYKTSVCPLAKVMRRELKKRGVKHCKVLFSTEEARTPISMNAGGDAPKGKVAPASISFVPSVAGLIIAGEVIKDIGEIR